MKRYKYILPSLLLIGTALVALSCSNDRSFDEVNGQENALEEASTYITLSLGLDEAPSLGKGPMRGSVLDGEAYHNPFDKSKLAHVTLLTKGRDIEWSYEDLDKGANYLVIPQQDGSKKLDIGPWKVHPDETDQNTNLALVLNGKFYRSSSYEIPGWNGGYESLFPSTAIRGGNEWNNLKWGSPQHIWESMILMDSEWMLQDPNFRFSPMLMTSQVLKNKTIKEGVTKEQARDAVDGAPGEVYNHFSFELEPLVCVGVVNNAINYNSVDPKRKYEPTEQDRTFILSNDDGAYISLNGYAAINGATSTYFFRDHAGTLNAQGQYEGYESAIHNELTTFESAGTLSAAAPHLVRMSYADANYQNQRREDNTVKAGNFPKASYFFGNPSNFYNAPVAQPSELVLDYGDISIPYSYRARYLFRNPSVQAREIGREQLEGYIKKFIDARGNKNKDKFQDKINEHLGTNTNVVFFFENSVDPSQMTTANKKFGYYRLAYAKIYAYFFPAKVYYLDPKDLDENQNKKMKVYRAINPSTGVEEDLLTILRLRSVHRGVKDGRFYASPEAAEKSPVAPGQNSVTFTKAIGSISSGTAIGELGYFRCAYRELWNRQEQPQGTVVNANTRRNNIYVLNVTGIEGVGMAYDPSDPHDVLLPDPKVLKEKNDALPEDQRDGAEGNYDDTKEALTKVEDPDIESKQNKNLTIKATVKPWVKYNQKFYLD